MYLSSETGNLICLQNLFTSTEVVNFYATCSAVPSDMIYMDYIIKQKHVIYIQKIMNHVLYM